MAQLVLKQFRCLKKNDWDSDSPYFVVFTAIARTPASTWC